MSADTNIPAVDLTALHTAILSQLSAEFPAVRTVTDYPRQYKAVDLPAILVDLEDMTAADPDPGTDQLRLTLHWSATCLVSSLKADGTPRREVRALAAAVATFVNKRRFLPHVSPAKITAITPDAFDPQLDQYEVWRVEWESRCLQGVSAFTLQPDFLPSTVYLGITPKVGPPHVDNYSKVAP